VRDPVIPANAGIQDL